MSDIKQSDVLGYFQRSDQSKPLLADALSSLAHEFGSSERDTLIADFQPGYFFVADTFTFGVTLADDEGENIINPDEGRSFGRWRSLKGSAPKPQPPFRTEPDDVSITRMIDRSSPLLLKHCLDKKPFSKAVIVKRSRNPVSGVLATILRLEFTTVRVKAVEWEDGDAVVETIKFKFNEVAVTYVQRKPDGSAGPKWSCGWSNPKINAGAKHD